MKIKTNELEKIYLENSNKKACEILGVVNATLISYLKQRRIKLKGSGNRNKRNNENNK